MNREPASGYALFDLDGTLIDGVDDLVIAINAVLTVNNLAPLHRAELVPMLGDGMRVLTHRAFAFRNADLSGAGYESAFEAFVGAYKGTRYAHTRLYRGVADTLRQMRADGWHIGLVSNKLTGPCNDILARLGIRDLFAAVVGGDATTVQKPDGAHVKYALARMNYDPLSTALAVMVGDHANDIDAARSAGIGAIAVALEVDATHARSLGADAVITEFSNLPAALAALRQP